MPCNLCISCNFESKHILFQYSFTKVKWKGGEVIVYHAGCCLLNYLQNFVEIKKVTSWPSFWVTKMLKQYFFLPISLVQAFRFFSSHSLLLLKQCWIQHHHESQFEIQTDNKLVKEGIVPRWGHRSNLSCDGVPALMREETGCISPCLSHHSPNWTHYWEDKSLHIPCMSGILLWLLIRHEHLPGNC